MEYIRERIVATACIAAVLMPAPSVLAREPSTNSVGMSMVPIEPDRFEMGSALGRDHWDEWPVHKVTISQPVPHLTNRSDDRAVSGV